MPGGKSSYKIFERFDRSPKELILILEREINIWTSILILEKYRGSYAVTMKFSSLFYVCV